ncbi:hypothetical protein CDN98_16290 [Roseateles terrae]|nr:hypothetical protein CDN98_16290 [Roseateles terrae]
MKKWMRLSLLTALLMGSLAAQAGSAAPAASNTQGALAAAAPQAAQEASLGCQRLRIALAPGLTAQVVARDWQSGEPHTEPPASLQLVGCDGHVLSQLPLSAPLAQLDPRPLRGAPHPTFLVSADFTQEAGSYNGPVTTAVEVVSNRLQVAMAHPVKANAEAEGKDKGKGKPLPIQLAQTLKAAWQRVEGPSADALLVVRSQPSGGDFRTTYSRYEVVGKAWRVTSRSEPGLWESEGDFPAVSSFPR